MTALLLEKPTKKLKGSRLALLPAKARVKRKCWPKGPLVDD